MAKQKRTLQFKVDCFKHYADGFKPREAFLLACHDHGTVPSGCMTNYANSYMSDDIKNFLRKKLQAGCCQTKNLLGRYADKL